VLEERVQRAVLGDELPRSFLSDARHALDVVDRVTHQREHVHHLPGKHAELLFDGRCVVPRAIIARVVDLDAVVHELKEVLVAGDDGDLESGGCGLRRQRADDIVGFVAARRDDRDSQRFTRLVHPRYLLGQIRRHRPAIGLVVRHQLITKGGSGEIERGRKVLGRMVLNQLPQHRDEDVDGVGGLSLGATQAATAHGVVRPVHL